MEYLPAYELSLYFLKLLKPVCRRVETVGSVKRADPKALQRGVHDLEFLLIVDDARVPLVFGSGKDQPKNKLERLLMDLKADETITDPKHTRAANGEKYKKFAISGHEQTDAATHDISDFCLELYIVTSKTWAIQNVIRTGPSAFSQRFVTNESQVCFHKASGKTYKGLLPDFYEYVKGETVIRYRNSGEVLDLEEEADAIRLLGLKSNNNYWIPPEERYMWT
jgi:hypothetical protein